MPQCPFYNEKRKFIQSQEICSSQQLNGRMDVKPYCTHQQSPAPASLIDTVGAASRLGCGGDLNKCQLPGGHP